MTSSSFLKERLAESINSILWNSQGLIPVITQQVGTLEVLMLAWMSKEALLQTLQTGYAVYWSRSRNALWRKGETSGNLQKVCAVYFDCDSDSVLLQVEQQGSAACHTGSYSCFFQKVWTTNEPDGCGVQIRAEGPSVSARSEDDALQKINLAEEEGILRGTSLPKQFNAPFSTAEIGSSTAAAVLERLSQRISDRRSMPVEQSYVAKLFSRGLDAILKKIGEESTETVMAAKDGVPERLISELADLWFHCVVLLNYFTLQPRDVILELVRREGISGLEEYASRKT